MFRIRSFFKELEPTRQMSEAFRNCIFLALSGGFQDAYTYFTRDGVFANAHWRQGILLFEIIILFAVGFMPKSMDTVAAVIVSFSCAMQVQTFRKVRGYSYASTMCIGNLRSGTAALSGFIHERKPEQLRQTMYYFGVIFFFAVGAGLGGNLSLSFGTHIIWVSCGLLLVSFLMMFKEKIQ